MNDAEKNTRWINNVIFPLAELLGDIEEMEKITKVLTRMEFFENTDHF